MLITGTKLIFTVLLLLTYPFFTGCAALVTNGTTIAVKGLPRAGLEQKAEAGDVQAQYELGLANCCMGVGFSTQVATEWLCKAAHQGHSAAMYELGSIYSGEISRTPAAVQKLRRFATAKESYAHAYMWLSLAEESGLEKAQIKLAKLEMNITNKDRDISTGLTSDWKNAACEYNEVFPQRDPTEREGTTNG